VKYDELTKGKTGADHGTQTHYMLHGCRCDECLKAHWQYAKERHAERSAIDDPLIFRNEAEMVAYLRKRGYEVTE
jgi:hypothetical protein